MADQYDLATMHEYVRKRFCVDRPGESADCAKLRKELKPILLSLISYAKIGDAGVAELQEDHRDATTFHIGLPDTMPEDHRRRFADAGKRNLTLQSDADISALPPSLRALMSGASHERQSLEGGSPAGAISQRAIRRDHRS